ncbi:alpha-L-fucosidase [Parabacteroides pacaensis]|uniref:alpha-L-fucosidase n=1 Tax=Parabacteroides pacaensis TaxID=2086575 RepID=UPI000D1030CB|nr:alpha-L-fucosidase [Parabacteroides pacaensis]
MKKFETFFCFLFALCLGSCKQITPPEAILPIPESKQVAWQQMETYAFVHFSMNTFNDMEWGYGDADINLFNPTDLDCEQWVQTFAKAGMKGVIFTAKHHDGFCMWPSAYTDYCVKNAPWKDGKGDVVRELSDACKKHGLKFAVYLSPWDRHQANYGAPEYVKYFHNQLTELMSNYGPVFEVWFDGANGGNGWYGGANESRTIDRKNYYNYPRIYELLDSLQPQAIVFSDGGPGCRWVGNEHGFAGETNWSFLRKGEVYPGYPNSKELQFGHEDGNQWTAAECDVSIRPGWFYHQREDSKVKTVEQLTDLYYRSVGHNATLLLNFPVDRRGKVHPIDSARAVAWHQRIQEELKTDLLKGIIPEASNTRGKKFAPANVTDNDYETYWATEDGTNSGSLTFTFKEPTEINRVLIQEYIPLGQRVKSFTIEAEDNKEWKPVDVKEETTTVGYKRIVRFKNVSTVKLRIVFKDARGPLCINNVQAFCAPPVKKEAINASNQAKQFAYKIVNVPEKEALKAYDGDASTCCFIEGDSFTLDLGAEQTISSFTYLPDQNDSAKGMVTDYELFVGSDPNVVSKKVAAGEFSNIKNNPIEQTIHFIPVKARYIRFVAKRLVEDQGVIGMANFAVL